MIAPPAVQAQIAEFLRGEAAQHGRGGAWRARQRARRTERAPYRLQNITWREFEASLGRLWGGGLVITPDASGNSATVRLASDPSRQVVLQIDRQANEIQFPAAGDVSRSWRQVSARSGSFARGAGTATQLVPLRAPIRSRSSRQSP